MKFFVALAILFISSFSLANVPRELNKNPMAYAEKQSKAFAEGDSYDASGWNGCADVSDDATLIKIDCQGTREILVFGGSMQKVDFACEFTFQPRPSTPLKYVVTEASCE